MNIDITIQAISNGYLVHVSGLDKPFCYHTMASVQQALPNLIQMAVDADTLAKFKTPRAGTIGHPHPMPEPLIDGHGRPYWNANIARGAQTHGDGEQRNPGEHADYVHGPASDRFISKVYWPAPEHDRHEDGKDIEGPAGDALNERLRKQAAYEEYRAKRAEARKASTYGDLRFPTEQRDYGDETTAD